MDLEQMIDGVSEVASSREYSELTNALRDRANALPAMQIQSNEDLIGNIQLPQIEGLRVSPRIFEPKDSPTIVMPQVDLTNLNPVGATHCTSIGVIVCTSIGVEMMDGIAVSGRTISQPEPLPIPNPEFPEPDPIPDPLEDYSRDFIKSEFGKLKVIAESEPFMNAVDAMYALPKAEQHIFVKNTLLDSEKREDLGIMLGDDIEIMRSAFADNRPTLFALVSKLPDGKKITITYDQPTE